MLAAQAMRAIAAGVVVTALVESILSGLGLWVAGIPEAGILTSVIFLLCVMQLGTLPVLIPAALWLVSQHQLGWGIVLTAWAMLMSVGDGVLRSWLIQRGARLPLMLVLGGVLGGLLAFGVAGIFIGPVLLAVAQRILERWANEDMNETEQVAGAAPGQSGPPARWFIQLNFATAGRELRLVCLHRCADHRRCHAPVRRGGAGRIPVRGRGAAQRRNTRRRHRARARGASRCGCSWRRQR